MVRAQVTRKLNNDKGFSLVELIIVVSILAIAAVPLMKSMGMAAKTNAKAQSIQNATSLGESIMEEMKSLSKDEMVNKYGPTGTNQLVDNGSNYVITIPNMTATQGEKFDVKVKIDKSTYSKNTEFDDSDAKENVMSANTLLLPRLEDIDTLSQAVLSSAKEFNRYDASAQNFFNQKLAKYPTETATITSKTIDIVKEKVEYPKGVRVKASITYTDDASPTNKYVRDLYTGTFVPIDYNVVNEGGSTVTKYKPLDSNIYIFYDIKAYEKDKEPDPPIDVPAPTINITDKSNYNAMTDDPDSKFGAMADDSHRVYLIRQKSYSTDESAPLTINFFDETGSVGTFSFSNVSALNSDGTKQYGKIKLLTNLDPTNIANEGNIYVKEARTRVYDITVELTRDGVEYAKLNSTKSASDKITP